MAFQLLDANHFPPRSQIHRMDNSNSENDHVKTQMGRVGFVIPWVYYFLSRFRSMHYHSKNQRFITVNDMCMKDLELMKESLAKAKLGIDMNLLAFVAPDQTYYSDSCPAGLRGYSNRGHTWRFYVPSHLQFRATNNLLEYLAAIITPWIGLLPGRLERGDCALSMTHNSRRMDA